MKAGHYLEDAVAQFWADATGQQVIKSSAGDWLIRSNERPYLQVSPDRTYWLAGQVHNNDNKGILECKTTQMSVDGDDLPKHWFCQLTYQLGVSGMQHGSLAWLTAGREFGYKDIDFDRDFYEFLVEEVERFGWTTSRAVRSRSPSTCRTYSSSTTATRRERPWRSVRTYWKPTTS